MVEQLKEFLKEKGLTNTGKKCELVRRTSDYIETKELEQELGVVAFHKLRTSGEANLHQL